MAAPPPGRPPHAAGADLVIPGLALAFALYFFWSIAGLEWEAKANGVLVGTVLLGLVALQVGRTALRLARHQADLGLGALIRPRAAFLQRLGLIGIMALFVATLDLVGTILGIVLAMAGSMLVLGVRDPRWLIGLPLAVASALHLMFVTFLGARLPAGPVERLLALLTGGGA